MRKIVVLGIDGFDPELVHRWINEMPNLKKMQEKGLWGAMKSTVPPTAACAWTCVQCGRNPGSYGFWDYTYRDHFSYGEPKLASSVVKDERVDCLHKILPKLAQRVALINVPASWPPSRIPAGYCIASSMTASLDRGSTWPESLKDEIHNLVGEYITDIFETDAAHDKMDKDTALKRIYDMDAQRFTLLKHFIHQKKCDYTFAVATGLDAASRLFYRYSDEKHRRYDPDSRYKNVFREYYTWIDKNIGDIWKSLDNNTTLFIHSAYGTQRLDGQINLNEWLVQEGYISLDEYPSEPTAFKDLKVNWAQTKAWATGYTGQIYINLRGREVQGAVEPDHYDELLDELTARIRHIPDEHGKALNTQVFRREDIHFGNYAQYGPDMFINFDECRWKTSEMVGYGKGKIHSHDTPYGVDDAGNGMYGYFCITGPRVPTKGKMEEVSVLNSAPTVLDVLALGIPEDMECPSLLNMIKEDKAPIAHDRGEKVQSRLSALGY